MCIMYEEWEGKVHVYYVRGGEGKVHVCIMYEGWGGKGEGKVHVYYV